MQLLWLLYWWFRTCAAHACQILAHTQPAKCCCVHGCWVLHSVGTVVLHGRLQQMHTQRNMQSYYYRVCQLHMCTGCAHLDAHLAQLLKHCLRYCKILRLRLPCSIACIPVACHIAMVVLATPVGGMLLAGHMAWFTLQQYGLPEGNHC